MQHSASTSLLLTCLEHPILVSFSASRHVNHLEVAVDALLDLLQVGRYLLRGRRRRTEPRDRLGEFEVSLSELHELGGEHQLVPELLEPRANERRVVVLLGDRLVVELSQVT